MGVFWTVTKYVEYWAGPDPGVLVLGAMEDDAPELPAIGTVIHVIGFEAELMYLVEDHIHTWKVRPDVMELQQIIRVEMSRTNLAKGTYQWGRKSSGQTCQTQSVQP